MNYPHEGEMTYDEGKLDGANIMASNLKAVVVQWVKEARYGNNPFFFTTFNEGDIKLIRNVVETTLKKIANLTEEI